MHSTLEECEDDRISGGISQQQHDGVTLAIVDALETNDIDLTFNRLCRELLKAEQQVLRIEIRRWDVDYSDELATIPSGSAASEFTEEPKVLLIQVITEFHKPGSKAVDCHEGVL